MTVTDLCAKIHTAQRGYPYPPAAFHFLVEAVDVAIRKKNRQTNVRSHVDAAEVMEAIAHYGAETFGLLARAVFDAWGVHDSYDFGRIVYALVDQDVYQKQETDRVRDFDVARDLGADAVAQARAALGLDAA